MMTAQETIEALRHEVLAADGAAPKPVERSSTMKQLPAGQLYRRADLSSLPFETTAELEPVRGMIGQDRAMDAISFGMRMRQPEFNLLVIGSDGTRMQRVVAAVLRKDAATPPELADWVYVTILPIPANRLQSDCRPAGPSHSTMRCML